MIWLRTGFPRRRTEKTQGPQKIRRKEEKKKTGNKNKPATKTLKWKREKKEKKEM